MTPIKSAFVGIILACSILLAPPAGAQEAEWVRGCEGYADVRGEVTQDQAKQKALNEARAKALQKASGLRINDRFIQRTTESDQRSSEFVVKEMTVALEGVILDETTPHWTSETIQGAPSEPPFQRLRIHADFKIAKLPPADPNFTVDLKLSKGTLVANDPLTLTISTSENAYLSIFNLAANDRVYILYPNAYCPSLFASRKTTLSIPEASDGFVLRPSPLPGHKEDTEVVRVIATRAPVHLPSTDKNGTLSVKEFFQWLYAMPQYQWTETEQIYTVYADKKG